MRRQRGALGGRRFQVDQLAAAVRRDRIVAHAHRLAPLIDVVELLEAAEQLAEALLDGLGAAVDHQFGIQRLFVGVGNAGERFDLAGQRLFVEALDVALDQFVDRASHVHFEEALVIAPHLVAHVAVGRNRRGDRDHAVARQQMADVADAPDVGVAIFLGKPESLGKIGADFVAVEDFDAMRALAQFFGGQIRERRFSRAGQARKPQGKPLIHRLKLMLP